MLGKRCLIGLVLVLLCTAPAVGQLTDAEKAAVVIALKYRVAANITYAVANNHELKLDVYTPWEAKAPLPVVVYIHGGGWVAGSKEGVALQAVPFLTMGFAVVNVEYRLSTVSPAPAAVEDCRCALYWVGKHAKEYNFDLDKVITTGGSAGGHLALTTAMIPSSAGFDSECIQVDRTWDGPSKLVVPKVAAVINWFGITDVADELKGPNEKSYAVEWLGSQANGEEMARRLSPLTYVHAGLPPVLTVHGDADTLVPYSHAVRLHEALSKAGVRNQLITIPGGGHGGFTPEQTVKAFEAIKAFLAEAGIKPAAQ